jgi:hypothetical protein
MSPLLHPIHFDPHRRRLWVLGQRCHHGSAGAMLTALSAVSMPRSFAGRLALACAGGILMAHDWKDRAVWFQRGWQHQP